MARGLRWARFWTCYWLWRFPPLTKRMIGPVNNAYQAWSDAQATNPREE